MTTKDRGPEVDFEAALPSRQGDDDLKVAMRTLRSGKPIPTSYPIKGKPAKPARRPKGKKTKPSSSIQKPKGAKRQPKPHHKSNTMLVDNNVIGVDDIDLSDNSDFKSATKLKDQMTLKELKFIGYFLTGENTIEKSMILAGYDGYHQKSLYRLGRKIVEKYESQVDDHRKLARAMGAGETLVFKTLLELIKSKNERIKLDATVNLAKILGLTKEQLEGPGGVTIIFEGPEVQVPGPGAPPALPGGESRPAAGLPGLIKPMMITR